MSVTTDGANVLRGKRTGVSARLRSMCNKLLLHSPCISHRCQLELKGIAEKECELVKDVNDFLENLFVFHKGSKVITNLYCSSVIEFGIRGKSAVIRVNGTRWIGHVLSALDNLFNGLPAHVHCYENIHTLDGYSESQKVKSRYFLKKLEDKRFLSFMLYMDDVLETVAIFSKVSQTRGLSISEMEDVLTTTIVKFDEHINDPNAVFNPLI